MATTQENLKQSNSFFRNNYRLVIFVLIAAIFLILGMVVYVLYQLSHRPLPEFYAIAPDNKKMMLNAYNEPNLLPNTLLKWASKAAVTAYTFDFVNYKSQILAARPYFTALGWADYQRSVLRLLEDIVQKQLFVNGVISAPPIISNQGILPGKGYVWRVQVPFLVTYQSAEHSSRQNFVILMTIMKVPTTQDPNGIGIDQFVMR